MNERQQIDWSQVIPGKTWLESPNGCLCRVDAVVGEDVWVYYKSKQNLQALHYTWIKSAITLCKWRIRGEWEDVTGECSLRMQPVEHRDSVMILISHNGQGTVNPHDYKIDNKRRGLRIYKRRTL